MPRRRTPEGAQTLRAGTGWLMAALLGRDGELAALVAMLADAGAGRGRTAVVLGETGAAAVLIEDAHWADASSIALLQFVVSVLPGLPVLLVLTTRDDPKEMDADVWAALAGLPPAVVRLPLSGLDEGATAALVHTV